MKKNIVILTGAGTSAESGVPTFRDNNGLWEGHRVEDVATPEAYERNPKLVHEFYNLRRASLRTVQPNPAHESIARLQREFEGKVTLVTQNVDDLHERAGSEEVWHMHGELLKTRCTDCLKVFEWDGDTSLETVCPECKSIGTIRPHIVWFGEIPFLMDEIQEELFKVDIFVAIGTSGLVYPAAGFVNVAKRAGAECIEFNLQETAASDVFYRSVTGKASETVTDWVNSLL